MKFSRFAVLGLACLVSAKSHNHYHRHLGERAPPEKAHELPTPSGVEPTPVKNDEPTIPDHVETAVATVYILNGKQISAHDVEVCLRESRCAIVGDKLETVSSSSIQASIPSPSSSNERATESNDNPEPQISAPVLHELMGGLEDNKKEIEQDDSIEKGSFMDGLKEDAIELASVNKIFPNGKIDCSEFPSSYGAVAADWIGLRGWTGVQKTPGFSIGLNAAISEIETAIAGEACVPGSFCSYACPPGYQKSQWPQAQGVTGQSIGGLFCNHRGKLELSRLSKKQLCTPGVGNIRIKNSLNKNVAVCRTDYPGTESETIALDVLPGSTVKVTCPDSKEYYRTKENKPTSAQYYINPSGYRVKDACTWGSSGTDIGNWAPVNMGVGKGDSGSIYVSLFQNAPTNPNGVLDFNINIIGDVSGSCAYRNGKFYKDGVPSPTGCTVVVNGQAQFDFS